MSLLKKVRAANQGIATVTLAHITNQTVTTRNRTVGKETVKVMITGNQTENIISDTVAVEMVVVQTMDMAATEMVRAQSIQIQIDGFY